MDINVDIGPQTTGLLQKLADQLGLTVQQILPWYVEQARLEGVLFFVSAGIFLAIIIPLSIRSWKKADFADGNPHAVVAVITSVLLALSMFPILGHGPNYVTKIMNPQYHAVKMIAEDVEKMVGKQ